MDKNSIAGRFFVALELPLFLQKALRGMQQGRPGIRWSRPEGLHVTLRFLGGLTDAQTLACSRALARVRATPFPLRADKPGVFLQVRQSIFWVGLFPCPGLETVKRLVDKELQSAGFSLRAEPFCPHITLGRARPCAAREADWLHCRLPEEARTEFSVSRVTLFSSRTSPGGALHTPVQHCSFADP